MKRTFRLLSYGLLIVCTAAAGCGDSSLDTNDTDTGPSAIVLQTDDGLADNTVTDIAVDYVFNGIWIGTLNGISFYSKADSSLYTYGAEYTGIPDMQITSLLVEGGATVHGAFLEAGLADYLYFFYAPIIGGSGGTPVIDGFSVEGRREDSIRLVNLRHRRLGGDLLISGELKYPPPRSEAES